MKNIIISLKFCLIFILFLQSLGNAEEYFLYEDLEKDIRGYDDILLLDKWYDANGDITLDRAVYKYKGLNYYATGLDTSYFMPGCKFKKADYVHINGQPKMAVNILLFVDGDEISGIQLNYTDLLNKYPKKKADKEYYTNLDEIGNYVRTLRKALLMKYDNDIIIKDDFVYTVDFESESAWCGTLVLRDADDDMIILWWGGYSLLINYCTKKQYEMLLNEKKKASDEQVNKF